MKHQQQDFMIIHLRRRRITVKIGIDKLNFYTPHYYVDMNELAHARGDEPEKYTIGLGQDEMAVAPITQDPVTLAANAADQLLTKEDRESIDLVMFGTETGIDHSKAAAVYVHRLLGLPSEARSVELKQACYSGTAAIQLAKGHIALNPDKKVLVLAADIARYGLATPGEVTQGAGAVAILLSADPKILALENTHATKTDDIMDFWRPNYSDTAYVDGKYSNEKYIEFFSDVWHKYTEKTGHDVTDFEALCFHLPYTKMGLKAMQSVFPDGMGEAEERILANYQTSTKYNRRIGNVYTASLYVSLLSLLELQTELPEGARIGLYSYGSGAVGEFFTGILQQGYRSHLLVKEHEGLFASREKVSVEKYERIFNETVPTDGSTTTFDPKTDPAPIYLSGIKEHMRQYVHTNE